MESLRSPEFVSRLRRLRARLASLLRRAGLPRTSPAGQGRSPEFESHREYVAGDDPRTIDWALYARLGRLFIKSTVREDEGGLHVLVDASESMLRPFPQKADRALEVTAALAYLGLSGGIRVSVGAFADRLLQVEGPFVGEGQLLRLLETISGLGPGKRTDLERTLDNVLRLRKAGGESIVLVSDFIDVSPYANRVQQLCAQGARLGAVQILAPSEMAPALRGNLLLQDPESAESVRQLVGYRTARELRRSVQEFLEGTERFFSRRASHFVRATADESFEEVVVRYVLSAERG